MIKIHKVDKKWLALDNGARAAFETELEIFGRGDDTKAFFVGELSGGLDFGEHGPDTKMPSFDVLENFFGSNEPEGDLVGLTKIEIGIGHGGDGNEDVGFD